MKHTKDEKTVIELVENSIPAVVNIIIISEENPKRSKINKLIGKNKEERKEVVVGGGSGFFVTSNGIILTNRHVVSEKNATYMVETYQGVKYSAEVIARDPINDIALLQINALKMPFLELGNSNDLKLGQTVITIGNALSQFHNSVSRGIISGLLRVISTDDISGYGSQNLRGLIQTDAAINPGNSGGPMIDSSGKIIGINAVVVNGAQNINFAIPASNAEKDIEDLRKFGKIIQPSFGVRYVMINEEMKEKFELPINYGAFIIKEHLPDDYAIVPGSSADKAGIKEGDIILEFNEIKVQEGSGLDELVQKTSVGDNIKIKYLRNNLEKTTFAILQERR
jgi:S1-C subfamily serine protease